MRKRFVYIKRIDFSCDSASAAYASDAAVFTSAAIVVVVIIVIFLFFFRFRIYIYYGYFATQTVKPAAGLTASQYTRTSRTTMTFYTVSYLLMLVCAL